MKLPRRSFLGFISSLGAWPFAISAGPAGPTLTTSNAGEITMQDIDFSNGSLEKWLRSPRIPVLDADNYKVAVLVLATLQRQQVEFIYFGGSTPGLKRIVSPGLVFRLEEYEPIYMAGYCHTRQEERTFRVDRLVLRDPS